MIKNVCVFCGAHMGSRSEYSDAANELGMELAHNGINLVYGGGGTGMMGIIADSVMQHGGRAIGVIPMALVRRENQHKNLTEMYLVDSMHERKAMMAEKSDAFIAMPGGFGTYEELFEVITWAQLGIHNKPIALLNSAGYYDPLLAMVAHGVQEGFIHNMNPNLLRTASQPKEIIPLLQVPLLADSRPKWLNTDQT